MGVEREGLECEIFLGGDVRKRGKDGERLLAKGIESGLNKVEFGREFGTISAKFILFVRENYRKKMPIIYRVLPRTKREHPSQSNVFA